MSTTPLEEAHATVRRYEEMLRLIPGFDIPTLWQHERLEVARDWIECMKAGGPPPKTPIWTGQPTYYPGDDGEYQKSLTFYKNEDWPKP